MHFAPAECEGRYALKCVGPGLEAASRLPLDLARRPRLPYRRSVYEAGLLAVPRRRRARLRAHL